MKKRNKKQGKEIINPVKSTVKKVTEKINPIIKLDNSFAAAPSPPTTFVKTVMSEPIREVATFPPPDQPIIETPIVSEDVVAAEKEKVAAEVVAVITEPTPVPEVIPVITPDTADIDKRIYDDINAFATQGAMKQLHQIEARLMEHGVPFTVLKGDDNKYAFEVADRFRIPSTDFFRTE